MKRTEDPFFQPEYGNSPHGVNKVDDYPNQQS